MQHGIDRLIDTLADGVIDKDQFTVRMNRAKARLADLDAKLALQAADEDRSAQIRSALTRLAELSDHVRRRLNTANWATKREIIRAVVQRIEIGPTSITIVLRLPGQTSVR